MSSAMDLSHLPDDVREKLAELELELSEGEKKLIKLLITKNVNHS